MLWTRLTPMWAAFETISQSEQLVIPHILLVDLLYVFVIDLPLCLNLSFTSHLMVVGEAPLLLPLDLYSRLHVSILKEVLAEHLLIILLALLVGNLMHVLDLVGVALELFSILECQKILTIEHVLIIVTHVNVIWSSSFKGRLVDSKVPRVPDAKNLSWEVQGEADDGAKEGREVMQWHDMAEASNAQEVQGACLIIW